MAQPLMMSKNLLFRVGFGDIQAGTGGKIGVQSYSERHLWYHRTSIT